ncbi:MAG: hypothetical protein ABI876_05305 [Bacteroidota bacterium]
MNLLDGMYDCFCLSFDFTQLDDALLARRGTVHAVDELPARVVRAPGHV